LILGDKEDKKMISSKSFNFNAETLNVMILIFRSTDFFVNLVNFAKTPVAVLFQSDLVSIH